MMDDYNKKMMSLLNAMGKAVRVGGWAFDLETKEGVWTDELYRIFELPIGQKPEIEDSILFYQKEDQGIIEDAYRKAIELGKPYDLELRFITAKQKHIWVRTICRPEIEKGKVKSLLGVFQDITEKKVAEEQRKALEKELLQAQKMDAIGNLAGGIAHDFNNILSPILSYSEMVMSDLPMDDPLQHDVKEIYNAGIRAKDLVRQILTFAQKRPEDKIVFRSSIVLEDALKFLHSTIPANIDIQYESNAENDKVLGDPTQLNRIVINLCTNAAHAIGEKGGSLRIFLDNEEISENSVSNAADLRSGSYLKLSVRDSGTGISPQDMPRIFEPYYTTKKPGEGTGLGLAIIHGIVQNYGGDIYVDSEIDQGTTFDVYLPLIDADVTDNDVNIIELPEGTERILIIDDEEVVIDVMRKMLEKLGYSVTARTGSSEALESFRDDPDGFDLVITDMTMPKMTGKELAKEIMSIRSGTPIILCTGFSDYMDEKESNEAGISSFIMKPVLMPELARTVREVLDK